MAPLDRAHCCHSSLLTVLSSRDSAARSSSSLLVDSGENIALVFHHTFSKARVYDHTIMALEQNTVSRPTADCDEIQKTGR